MIAIELAPPALEPVSVSDLKSWSRIERADEDALIARLVAAAREWAERETGLVLAERAFRLAIDSPPADGRVDVSVRPIGRVTAVTLFAADGEAVTVDPAALRVDADALVLGPEARAAAALELEIVAGFAPTMVPEALRLAILRVAAASYETRGLVDPTMQPALAPPLARALVAPFRRVRL